MEHEKRRSRLLGLAEILNSTFSMIPPFFIQPIALHRLFPEGFQKTLARLRLELRFADILGLHARSQID